MDCTGEDRMDALLAEALAADPPAAADAVVLREIAAAAPLPRRTMAPRWWGGLAAAACAAIAVGGWLWHRENELCKVLDEEGAVLLEIAGMASVAQFYGFDAVDPDT